MKIFECPPYRLGVGGVHCLVGVLHVGKAAHARNGPAPLHFVLHDMGTRRLVERGQAVLLNVALLPEPELFFHQILDRKPVAVPSPPPLYAPAAHRAIARNGVFYGRCQNVPVVRGSTGEGRPVIEHILAARRLFIQRLLENLFLVPKFEYFLLPLRQIRHY